MSECSDFVNRNSKYIILKSGDSFSGIFRGAKATTNPFDDSKELMLYDIEVDGVKKSFKSASVRIARELSRAKEGDFVTISREGDGLKTNYTIKIGA